MCAAIQLKKKLGIKAEILEKDSNVGGTWHVNLYPGCACDVPSHLYSFSFELNPCMYARARTVVPTVSVFGSNW
jgi:cation diffusion facilitator CzcD-associated flavoprotein CzcO